MDERPDDLLVDEARRGSREAFAELVRRHERKVYGVAFRLAGGHADADDLAQEVFLTAWRSLGSFRGEAGFSTWLYRIAVNTATTFLRKKGRERGRVAIDEGAAVPGLASPGGSPESRSAASELRGRLDEAVAALPAHFRAAFALVAGEGLSHAEAARALGCSENTVSWRMHKARRLLRERLKPYLEEAQR